MASLRNHPRLVGVAGVVILIIAAAAGLALSFDPNAEKGRIIAAVRRATGRDLVLAGPLRLTYGLHPTLEAEDIAFANMPGGSRPQMITAAQMAVQVALLPLLSRRVEIDHVTLVRPDILLETDAQGHGNWQFQRPAPSAAAPSGPASPSGARTTVALNSLSVEDGRVTWRGQAGQPVTVDVPRATLEVGDGPTHLVAQARLQTVPVTLDATLGTRAQLGGLGAWPVVASLTAGDATLKLNGTTGLPLLAHGYHGRVDLAVPDLARLGALLQQAGLRRHPLPPLRDVRFGATLAGEGADPGAAGCQPAYRCLQPRRVCADQARRDLAVRDAAGATGCGGQLRERAVADLQRAGTGGAGRCTAGAACHLRVRRRRG